MTASTPLPARSLLRRRGAADAGRVEMVELFFDLVFVFAVTQLSHGLLADLTAQGALRTALLLCAVWWVWICTSWVTNWLDPGRTEVRVCLFVLMLLGLALSASLPQAFGERAWVFALAYVAMQLGRTAFFIWAVRHERANLRRNFHRIAIWFSLSAVFWLLGSAVDGPARLGSWALALGVELLAPALYFHVPGLGRSSTADWDVDGGHMAERCALFVIIALGESLLVTGATFASQPWTAATVGGYLAAFVSAVAMWWLYFDKGLAGGHHHIVHGGDPGRSARLGYTYLHLPVVAGIIVCAVADELVLAHPDHASTATILAVLGGPALYLLGVGSFKWSTSGRAQPPLSHLVGLGLLAALALTAMSHWLSAVGLAAASAAMLLVVAVWEHMSLRAAPASHRRHARSASRAQALGARPASGMPVPATAAGRSRRGAERRRRVARARCSQVDLDSRRRASSSLSPASTTELAS
jgi:low temperature requirement protein LtrA